MRMPFTDFGRGSLGISEEFEEISFSALLRTTCRVEDTAQQNVDHAYVPLARGDRRTRVTLRE